MFKLLLLAILIILINKLCFINSTQFEYLSDAIEKTNLFWETYRIQEAIPCVVAGIDINGENVWLNSFGYSDVENHVKCGANTVMRTGSVSKPIGTALLSKLIEQGILNWDSDIHEYISESLFPRKQWKGVTVKITLRQLVSMTSGIRTSDENRDFRHIHEFRNVTETLVLFANDSLIAEPATKFYYSNFNWQLIGAIIESVTNQTYEVLINDMMSREFAMNSSRMERHEEIIYNRSRQYMRVVVDNHYAIKSASLMENLGRPLPHLPMGGVSASVPDLLRFARTMIKSFKNNGYLKRTTVENLWTPLPYLNSSSPYDSLTGYGLGWYVTQLGKFNRRLLSNHTYIHYSGSLTGTTVMLGLIPELDLSLSVIANMGGLANLDFVGIQVLEYFISDTINYFLQHSSTD